VKRKRRGTLNKKISTFLEPGEGQNNGFMGVNGMGSFRKIVKDSGESDLDGSSPDLVVKSKMSKLARLQSIYTYNRIDSLTQGFDNPLETTLANPKRMGHHLNAIDKSENLVPAYVPPTLDNFDEVEEEERDES
jgi:hypothetical protein